MSVRVVTGDRPATNSGVRSDSLSCCTHDAGEGPAPAVILLGADKYPVKVRA
jgi:hypothetical protein